VYFLCKKTRYQTYQWYIGTNRVVGISV